MNGAKFRLITMTLLTGASFAVACGGDGDDDDTGGSGTPTVTGTTGLPTTTSQTQTATSQGVSTSGGTTSPSTTSTTGSSTTGAGGSAGGGQGGSGGACEEDPIEPPIVGEGGEGGGGGAGGEASGAPIELAGEGWNFTAASELDDWAAETEGCDTCVEATESAWACGVMEVTVDWPAAANDANHQLRLVNFVAEDALRDLAGRTLVLQARMTSAWAADNGYDVNIIAQDFGDGSDWGWFATCWNGGDTPACPETPGGELFSPDDGWTTAFLTMDAAPADFATDGVIKLGIEIATKHYDGPTFTYDAMPVTFEINALVW